MLTLKVLNIVNIVKSKLRHLKHIRTLDAVLVVKYGLRRDGKYCSTYGLPQCDVCTSDASEQPAAPGCSPEQGAPGDVSEEDLPYWILAQFQYLCLCW